MMKEPMSAAASLGPSLWRRVWRPRSCDRAMKLFGWRRAHQKTKEIHAHCSPIANLDWVVEGGRSHVVEEAGPAPLTNLADAHRPSPWPTTSTTSTTQILQMRTS